MAQNFKIFYSWQSDLPGKDTRNIIGDSIDATVKFMANTITIIPTEIHVIERVRRISSRLYLIK